MLKVKLRPLNEWTKEELLAGGRKHIEKGERMIKLANEMPD